ncbi:MAG TPA: hypothetical protein VFC65_14610 [Prolixibacteraceae bacterium]|nr:hypothetical protein [Prolixibacteraceae bacterium]
MKKRNLFVYVILVVFAMISINVSAGNEESFNADYKISPDLNYSPNSDFLKSWEIAYGESQMPVRVFMKETRKGQEYLVRTKYFEVKYVNGSQGFGVQMIHGTESTVSESLNAAVLDQKQLDSQECISQNALDDDKVLEMIASYLPDLINEQYNSILN